MSKSEQRQNRALFAKAGTAHFQAGKMLTPFDCQAIDAKLFAITKGQERAAKMYATLRGAFNQGWIEAHARSTLTDWFHLSPEEELREELYAQILVATRDQIAELWKTESTN